MAIHVVGQSVSQSVFSSEDFFRYFNKEHILPRKDLDYIKVKTHCAWIVRQHCVYLCLSQRKLLSEATLKPGKVCCYEVDHHQEQSNNTGMGKYADTIPEDVSP